MIRTPLQQYKARKASVDRGLSFFVDFLLSLRNLIQYIIENQQHILTSLRR